MKILELFCGTKSVSNVFKANGWDVITIDNDPQFDPTLCVDMTELVIDEFAYWAGSFDVIWASPPCTTFSVASIGKHWYPCGKPKTDECRKGIRLLEKTLRIIDYMKPKYWFIENPRGMMRNMQQMKSFDRYTITYCQYGDFRMKPTDIWTNHPNPQFKPPCKNGDKCHESAPRGSKSGTQRIKGAMDRSRLPEQFCRHIFNISSKDDE